MSPRPTRRLGGLVLSGLIIVRVEVAERWHAEVLGESDLVSPWLPAAPELSERADVSSRILEPVEVAVLDRHFALRTARWPEIHAGLMRRLIARSRRLSLQSAINSIPRTQERLERTLWQLANRFGRVASGGLRLHLPMSHAQLATIVATQRPSVTIALSRLQEAGRIVRTGPHEWLLRGPDPTSMTGTAVLGSIVSSVYLSHLHVAALPAAVADEVRGSIFGAAAVAGRIHAPWLLASARAAFVHGMDAALVLGAGIALTGALLALLFLPAARDTAPAHHDLPSTETGGAAVA